MHPDDAKKRGLNRNDVVKVSTRRGEIQLRVETKGRNKPAGRPRLRAVLRRAPSGQQADPGRHLPDLERDGLQKCACKVVKA